MDKNIKNETAITTEGVSENLASETAEDDEQKLFELMDEVNINDRTSVIFFGSSAQEKLDNVSSKMLEGVKNKDLGSAGNSLSEIVAAIRGFDIEALDPNRKLGLFEKLFGKAKPLVKFLQKYEEVRDQIDVLSNDLEMHKTTLLTDVTSLDKLYDANLEYYKLLELYIKGGKKKLEIFDSDMIPEAEKKASDGDMLKSQELKDLRGFRDDLERRVYDLKLTRQVAMQSLPSIRLVQENDKSLLNKIDSTLINTIPLWRNQLAQTVTIFRSYEAARSIQSATDLTNELLESNAETLRETNQKVREQMERGVFDIQSIKKANQTLIDTIGDSLRIVDEGKQAREEAEEELKLMEHSLKEALIAAKAKGDAIKKG